MHLGPESGRQSVAEYVQIRPWAFIRSAVRKEKHSELCIYFLDPFPARPAVFAVLLES